MSKTLIGIFTQREDAEDAIKELEDSGYNPKDISIVMKDSRVASEISDSTGASTGEAAAGGAVTGAVIGGLAGLVGAVLIPGVGAFFIGGPIASALGLTGAAAASVSGAATGAVAGGLLGALMGFGLTQDEAKVYERRINSGAILLAVPARSREEHEVDAILKEYHAEDIKVLDSVSESRKESGERRGSHFAFRG